jgi:hypothetical protein
VELVLDSWNRIHVEGGTGTRNVDRIQLEGGPGNVEHDTCRG